MDTVSNHSLVKFWDTFVIYYSAQDGCWIAHSLRTDQFGTGDCVLDALIDGMKAVDQVIAFVKDRPGAQLFREAPPEVQEIARHARRLPDELYQIAHKRLYGQWVPDMEVKVEVGSPEISFVRKVREEITAC